MRFVVLLVFVSAIATYLPAYFLTGSFPSAAFAAVAVFAGLAAICLTIENKVDEIVKAIKQEK